ncbi:hypothetical protein H6P1_00486 (plasmid) [Variovorax sp. PBL-H6]|uniref:hypothetical protein n=1 Tax=unclassified Variovorax TaxID=663243 RepID=UPI00131913B3|nr:MULTISPECIES: hypothetical protein [unclassified Variovorax]VTU43034.1 hypothetical protein SRS16P1_00420 [Variovorax sp. SRS16]VTU43064.1 hypothetical protein E5P1_00418 [Variovorax sp. PBL-E5]VTU43501.1 hypothetical protein H6P1_00486 [Variovorax sp. PBL-H6]
MTHLQRSHQQESALPPPLEIAATMRRLLVQTLDMTLKHQRTDGVCALGSILLLDAFHKFTPHRSVIRGGGGDNDGVRDVSGNWRGHYWVELEIAGEPTVADITADQFGWPEIIIEPLTSLRDRYRAGDQAELNRHIESVRAWLAADEGDEQALRSGSPDLGAAARLRNSRI